MTITNPGAILWAVIAIPVIMFCLFRIRTRCEVVSTTMFWTHTLADRRSRPAFRQIRNLIFLLLQLLLITLLVFGLSGLFFGNTVPDRTRVLLIIDSSASMQVIEQDCSRFDAAKRDAELLIRRLPTDAQAAIVSASDHPRIECGLTSDRVRLIAALRQLPMADGSAGISDALQLAKAMLGDAAQNSGSTADDAADQILVLTDGCLDAAEIGSSADDPRVAWSVFGSPVGNLAISRFQVTRSMTDPMGYEVFAELSNFGTQTISCRLHLELNDELTDVIPLRLKPGESSRQLMDVNSEVSGLLKLTVEDILSDQTSPATGSDSVVVINGLTLDDSAAVELPPPVRIPVTLVTSGSLFLQRVLESFPFVDLTIVNHTAGAPLPRMAPTGGLLILHEVTAATTPAGNVMVISPPAASDLWEHLATIPHAVVMSQDKESAILRNVVLEDLQIFQAQRLKPVSAHQPLVTSSENDPLLLLFPRAEGDVLVLPISLEDGDLPLRVAFPVLFANALAWYNMDGQPAIRQQTPTNAAEGDLRHTASLNPLHSLSTRTGSHSLRNLLLTAALLLTMVEWCLYHRRWI